MSDEKDEEAQAAAYEKVLKRKERQLAVTKMRERLAKMDDAESGTVPAAEAKLLLDRIDELTVTTVTKSVQAAEQVRAATEATEQAATIQAGLEGATARIQELEKLTENERGREVADRLRRPRQR